MPPSPLPVVSNTRLRAQQTPQGLAPLPSPARGSEGCASEEDDVFLHQGSTYSSCIVGGQLCRTTFQAPSAPDEILEPSHLWILVCEPHLCGGKEPATEQSAKQNPQSLIPGEEGMKLYLSFI